MKRFCARLAGFALMSLFIWNVSPVIASEKVVADSGDSSVGMILDLLKEKKIISNEESASFVRNMVYKTLAKEDLKALVDLLRDKGVVTGEEAAGFIQRLAGTPSPEEEKGAVKQAAVAGIQDANKLVLPAGDKEFIQRLRELWIKKGNRGVDFDTQLGDIKDPEEIIGRMRVIGVITPAYAAKLDEFYRDKFLSGAVTTVLETK